LGLQQSIIFARDIHSLETEWETGFVRAAIRTLSHRVCINAFVPIEGNGQLNFSTKSDCLPEKPKRSPLSNPKGTRAHACE